jgi:hypothetical protein
MVLHGLVLFERVELGDLLSHLYKYFLLFYLGTENPLVNLRRLERILCEIIIKNKSVIFASIT